MLPLGPFDLQFVIGRGGMGEVWAARHRGQGLPVAVKVLTVEGAREPTFMASFRNEARAMAGLDHPHIAMVYDHGEVGLATEAASDGKLVAGTPYLVMELADQGSLERWRGDMPWSRLRPTLLALLDGDTGVVTVIELP